jgi:hypothetical protein
MRPTPEEIRIAVATIDRWTEFLRSEMALAVSHCELLEQDNPAAFPLQDAIIEKALRDTGLLDTMAQIERATERALQQGDLPPEVINAFARLEQVCKEAANSISSGAADQ